MIARDGTDFDIVLLTAEYYDDHPLSPAGVIARVLEAKGFSIGIIEKPVTEDDFKKLGRPKLFFAVTSGSIDSMLNNYTPLKKKREEDKYSTPTRMPDRAVIVYCNGIRRNFKGAKIVLGGIEASLRRFAHYDYWDNDIRRSILLDAKADVLVYGNGEKQIIELAEKARDKADLKGIPGTCIMAKEVPEGFQVIPSFNEVKEDKIAFSKAQAAFSNQKDLAQEYHNNYLLQHRYPKYTTEDLDWIYSLGYTRHMHPDSLLKMARFSVVTHRGCIGDCSYCSIALHQGDKIISRSEENILAEIASLTKHPDFKGYIDDLGGPSANMYGMDCKKPCEKWCMKCGALDRTHLKIISLMKKARKIKGVKKVFVRSGIRYDLAMESRDYIRQISRHHVSGTLKIAPEHFSEDVLALMNKDNSRFKEFVDFFNSLNKNKRQALRYYLMIGHPGDDIGKVRYLKKRAVELGNAEQFQLFTPTPMSISSSMYWTSLDPRTLKPVTVVHDYNTKKRMKRILLESITESH